MPVKTIKNLGKITFKRAPFPDPCFTHRKGLIPSVANFIFNPATIIEMQTSVLTGRKPAPRRLEKAKVVRTCLYAKKRKRR